MNITYLKSKIRENQIANFIAECVLEIKVDLRYIIKKTFSERKEDIIIQSVLREKFNLTQKIKYVDIGANHYKRSNNSYLFYKKYSSNGVLVEADPEACKRLKSKRKKDIVLNNCIGIESGEIVDFYILSLPTRNTMDKEALEKAHKIGIKTKEVIKVKSITVNDLLERESIFPDFISIDIEGMDYKVLRTIDFEKFKIKVICVESNNSEIINNQTMCDYLKAKKYLLYKNNGVNSIFYRDIN